jgi:RNA polymerase sigma-70 factor, ECF subfamily
VKDCGSREVFRGEGLMAIVMRSKAAYTTATDSGSPDELLGRYRTEVFRLALSIVGDPNQAEDVTQEALVRCLKAKTRFLAAEDQAAWVRKVTVRCALTALKKRRGDLSLDPEASGESRLHLNLEVRDTLARLTPEQRTILALAHGEGLSYPEISDALGIPEGTVASRLNAARAAFREEWNR